MSSVALANHILSYNKEVSKVKSPRGKGGVDRTRTTIERDGRPPDMHQQPINFGDKENSFFKTSYGPTTREAVNPDKDSYFRQNANINTIKGKKPKTPDQDSSKPDHRPRTAANDVIDEFRSKYMSQRMTNGIEPAADFISPRPSSARNIPHKPTSHSPPQRPKNQFSFVSNDFEDPTPKQTKTRPKQNRHSDYVIQERGNAIPIDEVLNTYKSSRTYKDTQPLVKTKEGPTIPKMSRQEVEREKRRNEELNARLRGHVYQPSTNQHQEENIYQSLKYINKQNTNNTKENTSLWGPSIPPPSNQGQARYLRKQNNEMNLMNGVDNDFSFASQADADRQEQNMFAAPAPKEERNGFTIPPRAEELTRTVNDNPSPLLYKKKTEGNNYVLSEATEKKFDINQVLHGYKANHVYKNNETSIQDQNPVELAKLQFEEKNQRNASRERARFEKLNSRFFPDQEQNNWLGNNPVKATTNGHPHDKQGKHDNSYLTRDEQIASVMHVEDTPFHYDLHMQRRQNGRPDEYTKPEKAPQAKLIPHEPMEVENHYQRGSDITPEPKLGPTNEQFNDRRGRTNTLHQRDDDGWVRIDPPQKVIPGPSTQALDYFNKTTNNNTNHEVLAPSTSQIGDIHMDYNIPRRNSSSKSNPNVTFGKKYGEDIMTEYQQQFPSISPRPVENTNNNQFKSTSKSEPNLFGIETPSSVQKTDMNHLNFSNMSSNLRRSRRDFSRSTSLGATTDAVNTAQSKENDRYLVIDNTKMPRHSIKRGDESGRSRSTLSSTSSMQSFSSSMHDKNRTTVMLARGWSGTVVSTSNETKQKYDYNVPLKTEEGSMSNLVFRNFKPIDDVKPTDRKEDALSSLSSLDRRLRSESGMNRMLFEDSMDWMTHNDTQQQNPNLYRESNFPVSELPNLNEQIKESGFQEGQDMRVTFYESLHKITGLVNQIIETMPKQEFPFKLTPTSYQGDFEKKGPHKIDLYLNIENLQEYDHQINFLLKDHLASYIILQSDNREHLKQFCARNRKNGEWVLSAGRIMVVFSYLINEKVRHLFERNSKTKREDLVGQANVQFAVISETELRLYISFPGNEIVYDVGLLLAFDVRDFPNIIEMNKNRQWPDSAAKSKLVAGGTHLLAQTALVKNHAWTVSFLKTRKVLLNYCDGHQTATSILLALQVINKTALSNRDTIDLLLPVHFIMILFWVHQSYRDKTDWNKENMSKRFIDVLIALKRCLEKKLCPDFFFSKLNYFENFTTEEIRYLLKNVDDVLENPAAYLHS